MCRTYDSAMKTQGQVHVIHPSVCVPSVSPELFEQFLLSFTQMFLSVRQGAEHLTQLPRLKVTG